MNRGLLVGINSYPGAPLRGCVNDVLDMAQFLTKACGFAMNDIRLLTDDRATTTGILERIGWLLTGLKAGDSAVAIESIVLVCDSIDFIPGTK